MALDSITQMPNLPITQAFKASLPAAPIGRIGPKEIAPAEEELGAAISTATQKVGEADVNIEQAKRDEKASELEIKAESKKKFVEDVELMPERLAYKELVKQEKGMEFVPTRDTVQDIAGLFGLIGVVGMVIGKGNAMQAMGAMNGMMEGHRKGRQDLFKQEAQQFEKNFKAMQAKVSAALAEYQEALKVKQQDSEAGELMAQVALARSESPFLKAVKARQGDAAVVDRLKEAYKSLIVNAPKTINELQEKTDAKANQAEQQKYRERMLELQERRVAIAESKGRDGAGVSGKALTDKQSREIEGLDSLSKGLEQLRKDFKPEFASLGVLGFGADLAFEAKRRLGDKKGQEAVSWWSRYERFQAPNRHALFGATLTGNELKNYQSFTAKKSDSPETVKTFLDDQIAYSNSVGNNKRLVFEAAGYKVPEAKARDFIESFSGGDTLNIQKEAVTRFGSYEPDIYDYGFENNKFYRDKK